MRITFKVATAGESGIAQITRLKEAGERYAKPDGTMDEDKVRRELSNAPGVQFSGDDDATVIAFAVEFLDRMRIAFERLMASSNGAVTRVAATGSAPPSACERRMRRGRCAYVRIDIGRSAGAIRCALSCSNPHEVVGSAEEMAGALALACADNLVALRDDIREQGAIVTFVEKDNAVGMIGEAEGRRGTRALREELAGCERRVNGYCSPYKTDCPFYESGKCAFR